MTKSPEISVVMSVYNEDIHDLRESINSILNQTYRNFEYIIIDDNPNNKEIHDYIKERGLKDKRIRLLFHRINHGLIYSENEGIELAKGAYIARLDADDVAKKNRLSQQLQFLNNNKLDLVCSNFSIISAVGQLTREYGYNCSTTVNQNRIKNILSKTNIAINPTFFFKKNIFNKLKGYRDTKINNCNVEDYDLVTRALVYGYKVGYCKTPYIYKRLRKNSLSYGTLLGQYILMNAIHRYLRKFKYSKIIPMKILRHRLASINQTQKHNFREYANARYTFNDKQSLKNLLKVVFTIIKSKIVFQRCFESLLHKVIKL